jgi:Tfp pilus assembly protein PilV
MKKQTLQTGQTLLEIILAFGIAIIVLGAVTSIIVTSLNNAQYTKNQSLASSYAQEGMNAVRNIRDSSWNNFLTYTNGHTYCINSNLTLISISGHCASADMIGPNGIFSREASFADGNSSFADGTLSKCDLGGRGVKVDVLWTDGKCSSDYCHKVELVSCFSNINAKPAP